MEDAKADDSVLGRVPMTIDMDQFGDPLQTARVYSNHFPSLENGTFAWTKRSGQLKTCGLMENYRHDGDDCTSIDLFLVDRSIRRTLFRYGYCLGRRQDLENRQVAWNSFVWRDVASGTICEATYKNGELLQSRYVSDFTAFATPTALISRRG